MTDEALDKAIKAAGKKGHHLMSDHVPRVRRWTCVVCELYVIVWKDGTVAGEAQTRKCAPPADKEGSTWKTR